MTTHDVSSSGSSGLASSLPRRTQPPSPTLTNPDMILPDYDDPDFVGRDPKTSSWLNDDNSEADFSSFSYDSYQPQSLVPATEIIYGNGTMLSDIGEVTEVESLSGSRPRRTSGSHSGTDSDTTQRQSPPTSGSKMLRRSVRGMLHGQHRWSSGSTSTVNDPDRLATLGDDFDDSLSIDDSNFQGDDEESLASSYIEEVASSANEYGAASQLPGWSPHPPQPRLSTKTLSKRAEKILANAKRRLTSMEGNLSMARNLSYSSISDGSVTSPISRPATAFRENTPPASPARSLNVGEVGARSSVRPVVLIPRSASALGAAGGYRRPFPSTSKVAEAPASRFSSSSGRLSFHLLDTMLEPVSEDDGDGSLKSEGRHPRPRLNHLASPTFGSAIDDEMSRSVSESVATVRNLQDQMQGLKGKIVSLREQARADSMQRRSLQSLRTPSPFTHARWDPGNMDSRNASGPDSVSPAGASSRNGNVPGHRQPVGQLRTVEARENASLVAGGPRQAVAGSPQPPISDGRPAGPSAGEPRRTTSGVDNAPDAPLDEVKGEGEAGGREDHAEEKEEQVLEDGGGEEEEEEEEEAAEEEAEEAEVANKSQGAGGDSERAILQDERAMADFLSESGDSLYHETFQHPVSHEDREDAFDYEHFFLHSAMGTLSQQGTRVRTGPGSDVSDDSVETARGPALNHSRRASVETLTSTESFITATEGMASRNSVSLQSAIDEEELSAALERQKEEDLLASKRLTFGGSGSSSEEANFFRDALPRQSPGGLEGDNSAMRTRTRHRPSVSSFESTGTNRSFPLVNRARLSAGVMTPEGSPEHDGKHAPGPLLKEGKGDPVDDKMGVGRGPRSPAIQMLSRVDQVMVERMVASLGRCVLGLGEESAGGQSEIRRRINAATRILEGVD